MPEADLAKQHKRRDWAAVLFAIALPTFVTLAYFVWSEGLMPGVRQVIYSGAKVLQFVFPVCWVWLVQKQRLQVWPPSARGILLGLAFGVAVLAAAMGLYHGWLKSAEFFTDGIVPIREKVSEMGVSSAWKFGALGIFYSLCHSFLEEYYWRWFVFTQLKRLIPLWPAIVVSALGFTAHHVLVIGTFFGITSPMTWLLSLAVAVGGVFWAWLYHRSESLIGPWIGHLFIDAAIFLIGYDIARPAFGG